MNSVIPFSPFGWYRGRRRDSWRGAPRPLFGRDFIAWIWVWRRLAQYFQSSVPKQSWAALSCCRRWLKQMAGRTVLCSGASTLERTHPGSALLLRGVQKLKAGLWASFPHSSCGLLPPVCSSVRWNRHLPTSWSLPLPEMWTRTRTSTHGAIKSGWTLNTWLHSWDWESWLFS